MRHPKQHRAQNTLLANGGSLAKMNYFTERGTHLMLGAVLNHSAFLVVNLAAFVCVCA